MPVTIANWVSDSTSLLREASIPSARLDAEIILVHTLKKPRTYLHAHGDELLDARDIEIANARLDLRKDRTPIAYIIGHKEFYGRSFQVTPSTLIPRPESEDGIELLHELLPSTVPLLPQDTRLVDVGTGSGILGITAKLEHPELDVHLTDISRHALNIAERNARQHGADVTIHTSDLLQNFFLKANYMIANLPYVSREWDDISPELRHEPEQALFADEDGLALIYRLVAQAPDLLYPGGYLLLEADPTQHKKIVQFAKDHDFSLESSRGYYVALRHDAPTAS